MSAFRRAIAVACYAFATVIPFPALQAQQKRILPADAKERNEQQCRRDAAVVRSARADSVGLAALHFAHQCPDTGAALLAERWLTRPTDPTYMSALKDASQGINDERIARALLTVVEDLRESSAMRQHALEVLATQLSPGLYYRLGTMVQSPTSRAQFATGTKIGSILSFVAGGNEISAATRLTLMQRLERLAEVDPVIAPNVRSVLNMVRAR
jgi:hypothetical protein